mgnify:CR=1 FL=1
MTAGPKLLDGEAPFGVDHLRELMIGATTAVDALRGVGAYWPPHGSTGIAHLCDVCRLPIPAVGVCSQLCAELHGRLLLDFATFSTAKTVEPLMRVFKDTPSPVGWIAGFFAGLAQSTFAHRAELDHSVLIVVPHSRERSWSPNATIWREVVSGRSQESVARRASSRVDRGRIDPHAFDVTGISSGVHAIVLDDLWTTGATIGSLAAALLANGNTVGAWTIGRQLRPNGPATTAAYKSMSDQ